MMDQRAAPPLPPAAGEGQKMAPLPPAAGEGQKIPPLPLDQVITPALTAVMQARFDQVHRHGHDAAADDRAGPRFILHQAQARLVECLDMLHGRASALSAEDRAILTRRMARLAALVIAAMDCIARQSFQPASKE